MIMPKVNLLQMPDPAAQTAKYVNMMNATKQQETAERQAAIAQKTLTLQEQRGAREEALQPAALAKGKTEADVAKLDYVMNFYKATASDIANSSSPDQAVARGERLKQQFPDPALRARIDETIADLVSDPSQFEQKRKLILTRTLDAKDQLAVSHSDVFDADGNLYNKRTSPIGAFPTEITPGVVTGPANADAPQAPRTPVTPTMPQAPSMERAPSATSNAPMTFGPDETRPLNAYQQEDLGRLQRELGMTAGPASFTRGGNAGQMSPDMVPAILDAAVNTGVMAQIDLDRIMQMAPPQARQGIMDVIRSNKIALQADAPPMAASGMGQQQPMAANPVQRPQSRFADMRGAPPPATLAQYQVGQQIRGRPQNVSPTPGIFNVPTSAVAAKSRAERPSAQELYDAEAAKIKAARDAGPAPLTSQQKTKRKTEVAKAYTQTQGLINKTYDPKEGVIALARKIKMLSPDQKKAITGFSNYIPSFRESSKEADTLFGNLKGVITAAGKDAAAASGAIGPIAVQEWKIVADQIANLDLAGMTPRALDAQMDRIIRQVGNATNLARQVYDVQYGDDVKEYPAFKVKGIPSPTTKTPVTKAPPGVSATEWKAMTPAERKLWQ